MTTQSMSPQTLFGDNPLKTREDFQQAVRDLFEPLVPFYEQGGARPSWGATGATYDKATVGLESFIRPLWAIVPLVAGGGHFDHWDLVRTGLINGTDPEHDQYWGAVGDTPGLDPTTDQRMVEMAAFGFALAFVPEEFFDPLSPAERQRVLDWLEPINRTELRDNNWQFFRVLVNLGFSRVGGPVDQEAVEESLDTLESNYLGDGWYQDGATFRTTDYYVPFAFHFYSLIYANLAGDADPERAERFRRRAQEFAPHWEARTDAQGRTIAYGRSMTYRFAGAGFWGALALADIEAVPWAEMRAMWANHLRWFAQQDIADSRGILTIGWGYPNLLMSESYNAPGSPYWALKAFLPLALPADHPFWTADEASDAATADRHVVQPEAHVVVNRSGTQAQMLNAGGPGLWFPRQGAAKYGKLAYSSAFPFALEPDDMFFQHTAESALALLDDSGVRRVRTNTEDSGIDGDVAWSTWKPFPDVTVLSVLAGEGHQHFRVHVLQTERSLTAVEGGFAVEWDFDPATADYQTRVGDRSASVRNRSSTSQITDLAGLRAPKVAELQPNSSLLWAWSAAPMLTSELGPGTHILVSHVGAAEVDSTFDVEVEMTIDDLPASVRQVAEQRHGAPLSF